MKLQSHQAVLDLIHIEAHDKQRNTASRWRTPYRCSQQSHRDCQQGSNDEDNDCDQYDWLGIPAMQLGSPVMR